MKIKSVFLTLSKRPILGNNPKESPIYALFKNLFIENIARGAEPLVERVAPLGAAWGETHYVPVGGGLTD